MAESQKTLQETILQEIEWAEEAWRQGNEGRARVCARRAAGEAIRSFFAGSPVAGYQKNAINALRQLVMDEGQPEDIRRAAARLVARANDVIERTTDPIADAWQIIEFYFPARPDGRPWKAHDPSK